MVYENITELCKRKKITVTQLERDAGLGNGTIRKWQNVSPTVESLQKVADALNISIKKLVE